MGSLTQALAGHTTVGIDTAPFIYLWERHPRYLPLSEALFGHLSSNHAQGVTSVITLIEACMLPQRNGRSDLVRAYERALLHSRQVRVLPIDAVLAHRAVTLCARYGIHVPDALQIAAAIEAGATAFVSNDRRLSAVDEIQALLLGDYTS